MYLNVPNKHAPRKTKIIRANEAPLMDRVKNICYDKAKIKK